MARTKQMRRRTPTGVGRALGFSSPKLQPGRDRTAQEETAHLEVRPQTLQPPQDRKTQAQLEEKVAHLKVRPGPQSQKSLERFQPGELLLRDIRRYQTNANLIVKKLVFRRLVAQITRSLPGGDDTNFAYQVAAVDALHHAAEAYLVGLFEDSNLCSNRAHRVTVMPIDLLLSVARRIRDGN